MSSSQGDSKSPGTSGTSDPTVIAAESSEQDGAAPEPDNETGSVPEPEMGTGGTAGQSSQGSTDADASASAGAGGTGANGDPPVKLNGTPAVYLLVDRSTSMFASTFVNGSSPRFGNYPDRWEAVRAAISQLEPYASDVAFGIATYTGFALTDPECPALEGTDIEPATGNFAQVMATLPPSADAIPMSKGDTPTGDALRALAQQVNATVGDNPRYIVLFTDGEPDTCLVPDPSCGQDWAVGAVQDTYTQGITTLVVGVGSDVSEQSLDDMAHAGQGREVMPPANSALSCISQQVHASGEDLPTDFYMGGWRDIAAGTYAESGYQYAEPLFYPLPTDDASVAELMDALMSQILSP